MAAKRTNFFAYCWANGVIEFGTKVPDDALPIASGRARTVRREIVVTSRLAYDDRTLLVPGIPEASNQTVAVEMLGLHLRWLKRRETSDFIVATRQRPLPKSRTTVRKLVAAARAAGGICLPVGA